MDKKYDQWKMYWLKTIDNDNANLICCDYQSESKDRETNVNWLIEMFNSGIN